MARVKCFYKLLQMTPVLVRKTPATACALSQKPESWGMWGIRSDFTACNNYSGSVTNQGPKPHEQNERRKSFEQALHRVVASLLIISGGDQETCCKHGESFLSLLGVWEEGIIFDSKQQAPGYVIASNMLSCGLPKEAEDGATSCGKCACKQQSCGLNSKVCRAPTQTKTSLHEISTHLTFKIDVTWVSHDLPHASVTCLRCTTQMT